MTICTSHAGDAALERALRVEMTLPVGSTTRSPSCRRRTVRTGSATGSMARCERPSRRSAPAGLAGGDDALALPADPGLAVVAPEPGADLRTGRVAGPLETVRRLDTRRSAALRAVSVPRSASGVRLPRHVVAERSTCCPRARSLYSREVRPTKFSGVSGGPCPRNRILWPRPQRAVAVFTPC